MKNIQIQNPNKIGKRLAPLCVALMGIFAVSSVNAAEINMSCKYDDETYSIKCGSNNTASGKNSSALGHRNTASGDYSSAVGAWNEASGAGSSTLGYSNKASSLTSSAVGAWNEASRAGSSALGYSNKASGSISSAFGAYNTASNLYSSAFGAYSTAAVDFGTAIGFGSVANRDKGTAGYSPVKKGTTDKTSPEWVATSAALAVGNPDNTSLIYYDPVTNAYIPIDTPITRQITGVAAGSEDTDAVNVAQLKEVNSRFDDYAKQTDLTALGNRVTDAESKINTLTGDMTTAKSDINTLKGDMTSVKGDLTTAKSDINTLKTDLGAVDSRVTATESDIGSLKTDMTTAKGDINTLKTDLGAVDSRVTATESDIGSLKTDMTTAQTNITKLQNDLSGVQTQFSSYATIAKLEAEYTKTTDMNTAIDTAKNAAVTAANGYTDTQIDELKKKGQVYSPITVAGDTGEFQVPSGGRAAFVGDGKNITTTADNGEVKVELNKNIQVDSVKVGNQGVEITQNGLNNGGQVISGVAAGVKPTDAVNVAQLNNAMAVSEGRLNARIDRVEKRANAGTAAAMAAGNLQNAAKPGGNSFSISGATFAGEAGYAMGYSTMSSDGKWGFNAFGNGDSRGRFGGGASVGFHW